jgi:HAAS
VNLTETGESRINGYLFVLERSLKTFLPSDVVRDAVREIESHLRERVLSADGAPNERDALEKILAELGPPLRVAQAYSAERTIDEAVATGRIVPMARAVWHLATTTLVGFATAFGLFTGYLLSVAFLLLGLMKPIFPNNVGFWVPDTPDGRIPWRLGADFPGLRNEHVVGGYWVVPLCLGVGFVLLVVTHRSARRFLTWWRERRFS